MVMVVVVGGDDDDEDGEDEDEDYLTSQHIMVTHDMIVSGGSWAASTTGRPTCYLCCLLFNRI